VFDKADRAVFAGDRLFSHMIDDALRCPRGSMFAEPEFDAMFEASRKQYDGTEIKWPMTR